MWVNFDFFCQIFFPVIFRHLRKFEGRNKFHLSLDWALITEKWKEFEKNFLFFSLFLLSSHARLTDIAIHHFHKNMRLSIKCGSSHRSTPPPSSFFSLFYSHFSATHQHHHHESESKASDDSLSQPRSVFDVCCWLNKTRKLSLVYLEAIWRWNVWNELTTRPNLLFERDPRTRITLKDRKEWRKILTRAKNGG